MRKLLESRFSSLLLALAIVGPGAARSDSSYALRFGGKAPIAAASPAIYSVHTDGVDEYLTASSNTAFQLTTTMPFTLSIWVKPGALGNTYAFFSKQPVSAVGWAFGQGSPSGRVCLQLYAAAGQHNYTCTTTAVMSIGTWVHLMACHQPGVTPTFRSSVKIMVNRALATTTTNPNTLSTTSNIVDATSPVRIGRDFSNATKTNANYADATIWYDNLCTDQAKADALAVITPGGAKPANLLSHPQVANLKAWWRPGNGVLDVFPTIGDLIGTVNLTMTNMEAGDIESDYP